MYFLRFIKYVSKNFVLTQKDEYQSNDNLACPGMSGNGIVF